MDILYVGWLQSVTKLSNSKYQFDYQIDGVGVRGTFWLRTNGVDANGAAAEVIIFDRSGEKVRTGTFGIIQVG